MRQLIMLIGVFFRLHYEVSCISTIELEHNELHLIAHLIVINLFDHSSRVSKERRNTGSLNCQPARNELFDIYILYCNFEIKCFSKFV